MIKHPLTQLDPDQVARYAYDENTQAQRVVIVGGQLPKFDVINQETRTETKIERIEVPVIIKETQLETVEKIIMIPEVRIVEVEKVIIQEKIVQVEVERPVIIKEIEIKEIEKTILLDNRQDKEFKFPMWLQIGLIAQSLAMLGIFIKYLFK